MQKPESDLKNSAITYAKYSGMAIQFLGACLVGVFLGKWLDTKMELDRPVWAVFLTVGFMIASMYVIFRQLLNKK